LIDLKQFFTGRFPGKFAVKWISKNPPRLAYVATLPCETLMSTKHAINPQITRYCSYIFKVWWGLITKLKMVYW